MIYLNKLCIIFITKKIDKYIVVIKYYTNTSFVLFMDNIDYAVERFRYMYRNDPIMDALYRGEINWGDIPDDDKPLEIISWKEVAKEEQNLQSLIKRKKEDTSDISHTTPSFSSFTWNKADTCLSPILKMSEFPSIYESISLTATKKSVSPPKLLTKVKSSVFTFIGTSLKASNPTKISAYKPPHIKPSVPKKPKTKNSPKSLPEKRTLFIHELPPKTTIHDIRSYFKKYGTILSITLPKHTDKNKPNYDLCKGFGHIRFEKHDDAMTAFTKEKSTIHIHNKRINIEFVKNEV